ncbi:glycosyltransferase family 4 protein [Salinimicrobium tongyeongense]|uniref:Glycosyltransferase family 4 protein n=1 Tax=Salinimicrobium tongyeongense TaxID=2809707 RepID=A0ABY6NP65_9FLAO|nr:glycosyltransferase family 4 protein [Salinimicrobium tongyeongense]UZH54652.1 glycosyltransferase family 4 protein [Salinimicrobium tongyeongense]
MLNKTILLVNDHIRLSGGGDAVIYLEKRFLESWGYKVFTIGFGDSTESNNGNYLIDLPKNSKVEKLNKFITGKRIKKEFTSLVNEIQPDLIHIHLISKFPLSIYSSDALKGVPVIQTLHGPNLFCATSWGGLKTSGPCELKIDPKCYVRGCTSLINTGLYWQLQSRYWASLENKISAFHCPSLNILNTAKRLGLSNSKYIPLGIDQIFMEEPRRIETLRPTLLFAGALAEQKGVKFLLPALAEIKKDFPTVLLKIAGRGNLLSLLKDEVERLDLGKHVEFLGFVPHEQIREFYLSGDIFLMPSIWQEQFGLVGPEAMACKLPCIATNVGGIPEWLIHNYNGLLIPPQDVDAIVEAVKKLLSDKNKRLEMGERGRDFVIQEFSPAGYEEGLKNMISELIS